MADTTAPRLFCFGLGYSASHLAHRLAARGWQVAGTVRTEDKAERLRQAGIDARVFDRDQPLPDPAAALAGTTHLLVSVPPDGQGAGDAALDHHSDDVARLAGHLQWAGYLSTTGVYGNRDGGWVDETSELRPTSDRSARRVKAESAWRRLRDDHGVPLHTFRLAGIYGPGRGPFRAIREGKAKRIDLPEQKFGRIHVDDICQVLEASIARPNPGAIYNVSDDEPAAPAEVTKYACDLLGVEPPPLVPWAEAEMSAMAITFWQDNKRVDNTRVHDELGVRFHHPSYREGLRAVLEAEGTG
ncbi:NAD(P)-dependent oxidoreductase [Rhodovibrio sodomensis]|uniref:NAD(P)-dependent oxidoreductase n=1 Tax=Rhodovibrio sodomensis TaxID=1088 RepID=A0ABS1DDR7_9PROT|nr:SDR family oxidoreductase [Rhodovibrio sodomensis]MBK1667728.1 NAD(P)-dependent oxidoreductase [Rhodovibrio sodomensis]